MNQIHDSYSLLTAFAVGLCAVSAAVGAQAQEETVIEEIVVRGERIDRSVKETAASVAVITAADLEKLAGPGTVTKVLSTIPNVTTTGASNDGPTIRGSSSSGVLIDAEAAFGGARPRATIAVDGRPLSFNEYIFAGTSIWDVESVEVFRGPQSTTQGRNSIAGALFVRTKDPTYDFNGSARLIGGNFNQRQGSFAVGGPIVDDQIAFRVSADYREHQSYAKLAPDATTGAELGVSDPREDSVWNARAKFLIEPSAVEGLSVLLSYAHAESARPQTEEVGQPFEDLVRFNLETSYFEVESDGLTARLAYDLSEAIKLSNTTTYADVTANRLAPVGFGNAELTTEELSNETLLNFNNNRFKGVAGLYFFDATGDDFLDLTAFEIDGVSLGGGNFDDDSSSKAVFGEVEYSPTDVLHFTVGGRYQEDQQRRVGGFGLIGVDFDLSFDAFLPKFAVSYDLSDDTRIGIVAQRGYNPGGETFSFATLDNEEFREEYNNNYEFYWRSRLLDGRMLWNANLFYTDFIDAQRVTLQDLGGGFTLTGFNNAEKATAYGFESDVSLKATDMLQVAVGLGYNNTEIDEYQTVPELVGSTFQRAPKFTGSVSLDFNPSENWNFGLTGRYSSSYFSDDENIVGNRIGGYFILDALVAYERDAWRIFVSGTNLTDKFYPVSLFGSGTQGVLGDPLEYQLGVQFKF
jgi:iron complex outermembrane recepter protein